MAGAGTYGAYKQAYADKPIDVAGAFVKGSQKVVDAVEAKRKEEKLDAEKANAKKDRRKATNTKLYGDSVARLLDTQEAPPSAQEISIQAGDQIHEIIKNSGLEGIDLQRALDNVIKDSNSAVTGITQSALRKEAAPKDDYYRLSGAGIDDDAMEQGNLTFMYRDGRGVYVGTDDEGEPIEYSMKDWNAKFNQKAEDIPQVNMAGGAERLETVRKSGEYNFAKFEDRQIMLQEAQGIASSAINVNQPIATTRFLVNQRAGLGISDEEAQQLIGIGQRLDSNGEVTEKELALLQKYLPKAQEMYKNSIAQLAFGQKIFQDKNPGDTGYGSGGSGGDGDGPADTGIKLKDKRKRLSLVRGLDAAITGIIQQDPAIITEYLGGKPEDVNYSVAEDGSVQLAFKDADGVDVTIEGTNGEDFQNNLADYISDENGADNLAFERKYSDKANLLGGKNFDLMAEELNVSNEFSDKDITVEPSKTGIVLNQSGRKIAINLVGLSASERKQKIDFFVEQENL